MQDPRRIDPAISVLIHDAKWDEIIDELEQVHMVRTDPNMAYMEYDDVNPERALALVKRILVLHLIGKNAPIEEIERISALDVGY